MTLVPILYYLTTSELFKPDSSGLILTLTISPACIQMLPNADAPLAVDEKQHSSSCDIDQSKLHGWLVGHGYVLRHKHCGYGSYVRDFSYTHRVLYHLI